MFRPFSDRVLVRRHTEASSNTTGGLIVPDSAKDKPQEGTVVAIGLGYLSETGIRTPLQCGVGEHIYFGKFAGTEITVDGEKLLVLRESEIIGVLEYGYFPSDQDKHEDALTADGSVIHPSFTDDIPY